YVDNVGYEVEGFLITFPDENTLEIDAPDLDDALYFEGFFLINSKEFSVFLSYDDMGNTEQRQGIYNLELDETGDLILSYGFESNDGTIQLIGQNIPI
ncbi:MAG: hypothetical protein LC670_14270, partial [Flavobacteriales bacterium]|nr:hypothetical protein [Flavobacteriales bacterium]